MLPETHAAERGHAFYPPAAQADAIPPLYGTQDTPTADKVLHLHYFVRDCDWWIAELDPERGLAFGYACLNGDDTCAEWGYIDLTELEAIFQPAHVQTDEHGRPARILPRLIIERDLHWTPARVADIALPGWRATA